MTTNRQHATLARERSRPKHPAMTAVEARSFHAPGQGYMMMALALASRRENDPVFSGCTCEPYTDCFTFGRWRAQGMHVKAGQHGIRHAFWLEIEGKEQSDPADDGEETRKPRLRPWTAAVFCRCQVQ